MLKKIITLYADEKIERESAIRLNQLSQCRFFENKFDQQRGSLIEPII